MRSVAGPAAIALGTVNVAVSLFGSSSTRAVCAAPPAAIVTLWNVISAALRTMLAVDCSRRTSIDSSPANVALARSGVTLGVLVSGTPPRGSRQEGDAVGALAAADVALAF